MRNPATVKVDRKGYADTAARFSSELLLLTAFGLILAAFCLTRRHFGTDINPYLDMIGSGKGEILFSTISNIVMSATGEQIIALNLFLSASIALKVIGLCRYNSATFFLFSFCAIAPEILAKDFGTLRQGLAISVLFLVLPSFQEEKIPNKNLLLLSATVIATGFHWSAPLMVSTFLFIYWMSKRSFIFFASLIAGLIIVSSLILEILPFLRGYNPLLDFLVYKIERYYYYEDQYIGGSITQFLPIAEGLFYGSIALFYKGKSQTTLGFSTNLAVYLKFLILLKVLIFISPTGSASRLLNLSNIFFSLWFVSLVLELRPLDRTVYQFLILFQSALACVLYINRYEVFFSRW